MAILQLGQKTTSSSTKKGLDFNDVRYQSAEKLKSTSNKANRGTFTLYDDKNSSKISVRDISAAYVLSDKKLPIGELLNKMLDLIVDLEDGTLDSDTDAIYAWKFSKVLVKIYEDKLKRKENMNIFDNSLKNIVIGNRTFQEQYPNKYTQKTNFMDPKISSQLIVDIINVFKNITIPALYEAALVQSQRIAEVHENKILNKIVEDAEKRYGCTVESFYEINQDEETGLNYSTNTIILHMKNGYDISIIGYVGTEHDDKFSVSSFDANDISIAQSGERFDNSQLEDILNDAASQKPVSPLTKLLDIESDRNKVLKQQYEILQGIRPMIHAEALELEAAESVVGKDYIWGCQNFRLTNEDLPDDFKVEDVELPTFDESKYSAFDDSVNEFADIVGGAIRDVPTERPHKNINNATFMEDDIETTEQVKDGDQSTMIIFTNNKQVLHEKKKKVNSFDMTSTLLPGIAFIDDKKESNTPSITQMAKPAPIKKESLWKDEAENKIDTLFPGIEIPTSNEAEPMPTVVEEPVVNSETKTTEGPIANSDPNSIDDLFA